MAPKTEGFSLTASGSSPSLFIAMPVTTTFPAATAMDGSTQTTAVDYAVPLFAALTVQGNHTDGANAASRPLFIFGQQQKSKAKCLKKKIRSARVPQKCDTPQVADDGAIAARETESCKPTGDKPTGDKPTGDKPTGDKPCPPVADGPTDDAQNDSLFFPSKPKILAQESKHSVGDKNALDASAPVTLKQPVGSQAGFMQSSFTSQPVLQPPFAPQPFADASKSAGASPSHSARNVAKNHAHIFSFNPNRHKLNSGCSLGKAHSIDFLSRPALSPVSRSNSNSSTSAFAFKPNAGGAFANASAVNVSAFSFKPQAIVSIGNEPKGASRPVPDPSGSDDPKSAFSTFSFRPNASGTFGNPPTVGLSAACKPNLCADNLKDSISPFSFQPSASSSFGNAPTFNFVYNPTPAKNRDCTNKMPMFAVNARESALNHGCLFGNATIFGKNEIAHAGFTFSPSPVSKTSGAFFPAVNHQTQAKFSFGSGEDKSPGQYPGNGNPEQQPSPKILRQSSTGFLFTPSRFQTSNCLGVASSNTLFNIGAAQPAVAQRNKPEVSNLMREQAPKPKEPLRAADTTTAPTQTMQRFSFGTDKAPAVSLLPASGSNPFVVQIQNISNPGGNSSAGPQAVSISHTNTPKPCISINTNNNLIIQITNDSVQVIINSSSNS